MTINPDFNETPEQRDFRQKFMRKIHAVYRFDESLGIMDLGEEKKVSLHDIYVPLRFSEQELNEDRVWDFEENTLSLLDTLKESRHVVFSGRPGSGKTTISRMLINLLSSRELTALTRDCGRRIPLYFKLRDYDFNKISSADKFYNLFLASQSKTLGFNITREYLDFFLENGWCFLIFDGVDEVGGLKNRKKIRKFIMSFFGILNPDNYIIVTSRPSGLENLSLNEYITPFEKLQEFPTLKLFHVDSFNKAQALDFSQKWFALREENPDIVKNKANEFLNSLENIPSLSALRRRPVFLTMMAHIHTTKGKLPYSRAMAYEYMVAAYIETIDIARRLHKEMYHKEKFVEWSFDDKIKLLQEIAYNFQNVERKVDKTAIVLTRNVFLILIKKIIYENKESWQTIKPEHANVLLQFFIKRTGLLHEPEEGKIQFSHLSFQEFLTARCIYKKVIEDFYNAEVIIKKEIETKLSVKFFNRWREVILLFFSLNKAATDNILKNVIKDLKTDNKKKNLYVLIIEMLDSEEYGIKESQTQYWVDRIFEFISGVDVKTERKKESLVYNIGYNLIIQYFQKINRQSKFDCAINTLKRLLKKYFDVVKNNPKDIQTRKKLENLLYSISYNEDTVNEFKSEITKIIPVLLNRNLYDSQFIACAELFADYFNEFDKLVIDFYTLNETIIWKNYFCSNFSFLSKNGWRSQFLEWNFLIEELYLFNIVESIYIYRIDAHKKLNKYLELLKPFIILRSKANELLNKHWYINIWQSHHSWYRMDKQDITIWHDWAKNISINGVDKIPNIENIFPKKIYRIINKIRFRDKIEDDKINRLFGILLGSWLMAYSHFELERQYRKLQNPFKTYSDLKKFYDLLDKPNKLYDYLLESCSDMIDKKTFLKQYNEYNKQPYSMAKMTKNILDLGEESFVPFSAKKCLNLSEIFIEDYGIKLKSGEIDGIT